MVTGTRDNAELDIEAHDDDQSASDLVSQTTVTGPDYVSVVKPASVVLLNICVQVIVTVLFINVSNWIYFLLSIVYYQANEHTSSQCVSVCDCKHQNCC